MPVHEARRVEGPFVLSLHANEEEREALCRQSAPLAQRVHLLRGCPSQELPAVEDLGRELEQPRV